MTTANVLLVALQWASLCGFIGGSSGAIWHVMQQRKASKAKVLGLSRDLAQPILDDEALLSTLEQMKQRIGGPGFEQVMRGWSQLLGLMQRTQFKRTDHTSSARIQLTIIRGMQRMGLPMEHEWRHTVTEALRCYRSNLARDIMQSIETK